MPYAGAVRAVRESLHAWRLQKAQLAAENRRDTAETAEDDVEDEGGSSWGSATPYTGAVRAMSSWVSERLSEAEGTGRADGTKDLFGDDAPMIIRTDL